MRDAVRVTARGRIPLFDRRHRGVDEAVEQLLDVLLHVRVLERDTGLLRDDLGHLLVDLVERHHLLFERFLVGRQQPRVALSFLRLISWMTPMTLWLMSNIGTVSIECVS